MVGKIWQTLALVLVVLCLVATGAMAADMTCTEADKNSCTMAKGGDGKETKVAAPGARVGDKMTCTKKLMQ